MTQVLDYSLARPDPVAIKTAGYVGVLRYVAPVGAQSGSAFGGADDSAKVIFASEYAALRAAGLQVALNWEWYAARPKEGAAAGTADATEALRQANALGYHGAIYFSVDYDAPEADQPAINAYFQAAAQVIGVPRLGAYGGYWPLKRLFDAGLICYGWQTLAWSGGNRESRAHLYQTGATAFNNGADINDILKSDWAGGVMTFLPDYFTTNSDGTITCKQNGIQVYGRIQQTYMASADPLGEYGLPISGEQPLPKNPNGEVFREFERGDIWYDPQSLNDPIQHDQFGCCRGHVKRTSATPPPPPPVSDPKADAAKAALKAWLAE